MGLRIYNSKEGGSDFSRLPAATSSAVRFIKPYTTAGGLLVSRLEHVRRRRTGIEHHTIKNGRCVSETQRPETTEESNPQPCGMQGRPTGHEPDGRQPHLVCVADADHGNEIVQDAA